MSIRNPLSPWVESHMQKPDAVEEDLETGRNHLTENQKRALSIFLDANDRTVLEEKMDGDRRMMMKSGGKTLLVTPHNGVYSEKDHPNVFSEFDMDDDTILDGEFLKKPDKYYIFDILCHKGDYKVQDQPLLKRKELMKKAIRIHEGATHIGFLPWTTVVNINGVEEIDKAFNQIIERGGEGVVVKAAKSAYGDNHAWLKFKTTDAQDVFVKGLIKKEHELSYTMGAHTPDGNEIELGEVYSAIGSVDKSQIGIGTILSVRYQPSENFKHLRHPVILRIRDDKDKKGCIIKPQLLEQIHGATSSGI